MTVRDFMNYACYIEYNSENLRFFLWYKDYCKRFEAASKTETDLSLEWTKAQQEAVVQDISAQTKSAVRSTRGINKETFMDKQPDKKKTKATTGRKDPFTTPPRTPTDKADNSGIQRSAVLPWEIESDKSASEIFASNDHYKKAISDAFDSVGVRQPCEYFPRILNTLQTLHSIVTIQPFREEIDRIVAIYLLRNYARCELNLSDRHYISFFRAYATTTHPSIFRKIVESVEANLRQQSHPNFVRWSICNGNPARVWFARGLGISTIVLGLVLALVLTTSSLGRGYRALAAILWFIGISTLIAAYKGMCVVLHGLHHRHLRPWEIFTDPETDGDFPKNSFDTFSTRNSYEDEPWIIKYDKRNIIRKIFDREIWIQEPALRQIQDTIFLQSVLGAILFAALLTAIFVALPKGEFF